MSHMQLNDVKSEAPINTNTAHGKKNTSICSWYSGIMPL